MGNKIDYTVVIERLKKHKISQINNNLQLTRISRARALNSRNWATWTPKENGLIADGVGSIVEAAAAKLHPFLKLGTPMESK